VSYLQSVLVSAFVIINLAIIWTDIKNRQIPNRLLIGLLILLPIWYIAFPLGQSSDIILYAIVSLILLVGGVVAYKKNGFLGSGDIKYASLIILYLAPHSLPLYIGNVGAITLIILVLWIVMILGQVLAMRGVISRGDLVRMLPERSWRYLLSGI
jgi:Flp pilus assembly protein protease CpaA